MHTKLEDLNIGAEDDVNLEKSFRVHVSSEREDARRLASLRLAVFLPQIHHSTDAVSTVRAEPPAVVTSAFAAGRRLSSQRYSRSILSLEQLQTSRMLIEKTYEMMTENPSLIQGLQRMETGVNDSVMSTKDPDFFKLSTHIDVNKNYLELIHRSLLPHTSKHLSTSSSSSDLTTPLLLSSKGKYSLSARAFASLDNHTAAFSHEVMNAYISLLNEREKLLGLGHMLCLDTLMQSRLMAGSSNTALDGAQKFNFKHYREICLPVETDLGTWGLIISDLSTCTLYVVDHSHHPRCSDTYDSLLPLVRKLLQVNFDTNVFGKHQPERKAEEWEVRVVGDVVKCSDSDSGLFTCLNVEQLSLLSDMKEAKFTYQEA